jgi:predicted membrane protein (TIGR00267 family)
MISCSLALGISTGVSVYEAENLEREKRIAKLEKAMLTDLEDTQIATSAKIAAAVISLISFLTPLLTCVISISPFVLFSLGFVDIKAASLISVASTLSTLFFAGIYLGRNDGSMHACFKGMRMVVFGFIVFLIGFWIKTLI